MLNKIGAHRFLRFLYPRSEDFDQAFQSDLWRQARLGLLVLGAVWFAAGLFRILTSYALFEGLASRAPSVWELATTEFAGLAMMATSRASRSVRTCIWVALVSAWATFSASLWGLLLMHPETTEIEAAVFSSLMIMTVLVVAACPLRPAHVLLLVVAGLASYEILSRLAREYGFISRIPAVPFVDLLLLTGAAMVVSGASLERMRKTYKSYQETLAAYSRVLLADNAAAMGRIAAALSHELNTPAGVVKSTLDTLRTIERKRKASGPEGWARLEAVQDEVLAAAEESASRIGEIVRRIQHFTDLDRAEVRVVDLKELLQNVAEVVRAEAYQTNLTIDVRGAPLLARVRPQQISAVFSRLLHQINELGTDVRIAVEARPAGSSIEVTVHADGASLSDEEAALIFVPGFRDRGGRARFSNWDLFTARSLLRGHGGDLQVTLTDTRGIDFIAILSSLSTDDVVPGDPIDSSVKSTTENGQK